MDIILRRSLPKLREKLLEALQAVLPIVAIVLVLCFSVAPVSPSILLCFLLGAAMIVVGIMFFTLGAEMSMTPMGERVGAVLTRSRKLPVILVTAKTGEIDAVKGLDSGADDYITKPFGVMELISRVKALLRRIDRVKKEDLNYGTIRIDVSRHTVQVDGNEVELTYKEYEILKYLMKNRGIVLTRDSLMEKIWGYDFEHGNRTVDVHIQSLRKKLGTAGDAIKTIRNVGYKIGD